jgi:uncharacterized protein
MKIGLLSDTHGWIHPKLYDFFGGVDEIWHAGDIGNAETADMLSAIKPIRAVYGNIDGSEVRSMFKKSIRFNAGGKEIYITHIGGYPGHYDHNVRDYLQANPPDVFICGHSHIARVMYDNTLGFLYINPGAAGYTGFHKVMTAIRFQIDDGNIHDLELIELGERGNVRL